MRHREPLQTSQQDKILQDAYIISPRGDNKNYFHLGMKRRISSKLHIIADIVSLPASTNVVQKWVQISCDPWTLHVSSITANPNLCWRCTYKKTRCPRQEVREAWKHSLLKLGNKNVKRRLLIHNIHLLRHSLHQNNTLDRSDSKQVVTTAFVIDILSSHTHTHTYCDYERGLSCSWIVL